ncbi:zinc finger protein 804B [Discoglossus pictus]
MACYYLVISSTHLSNGHFRSIKGVFRGPLRKTGTTLPGYAEKGKAIANALEDLKANFYCELCDKQYHKHQEFDNHINSYDHAHKQRLKELKQREFARNVASKSWKDEKKQEKALKRLHQLAELRKQPDCVSDGGPIFKVPRLRGPQETFFTSESGRIAGSRCTVVCKGEQVTNGSVTENKQDILFGRDVLNNGRCCFVGNQNQLPFSNGINVNNRAGVSFCFSKKALLKLDSSASVFNENTEEANECNQFLNHKTKQMSVSFRHYAHVEENARENSALTLQHETDDSMQGHMPANVEIVKDTESSRNETKETNEIVQSNLKAKTQCSEVNCADPLNEIEVNVLGTPEVTLETSESIHGQDKSCLILDNSSNEHTVTNAVLIQNISEDIKQKHDEDEPSANLNVENLNSSHELVQNPNNCPEPQLSDSLNNNAQSSAMPFLNVLSKDGSTNLQWPTELLLFTKTEPSISYACNPLYFDFKCSRKNTIRKANERVTKNCEKHDQSKTTNEKRASGNTTDRELEIEKDSQSPEPKREKLLLEKMSEKDLESYNNYGVTKEITQKANLNNLHENTAQDSTHLNTSQKCIFKESNHSRKRKRSCHGWLDNSKESLHSRVKENNLVPKEDTKTKILKTLHNDQFNIKDKNEHMSWSNSNENQHKNYNYLNRNGNGISWDNSSDKSSSKNKESCSESDGSSVRCWKLSSSQTSPCHKFVMHSDSLDSSGGLTCKHVSHKSRHKNSWRRGDCINGKHNCETSSDNECISYISDKKQKYKCRNLKHKTVIDMSKYESPERQVSSKRIRKEHRSKKKYKEMISDHSSERLHTRHAHRNDKSTSIRSNNSTYHSKERTYSMGTHQTPHDNETFNTSEAKETSYKCYSQNIISLSGNCNERTSENIVKHIIVKEKKTLIAELVLERGASAKQVENDNTLSEYSEDCGMELNNHSQSYFAVNFNPSAHGQTILPLLNSVKTKSKSINTYDSTVENGICNSKSENTEGYEVTVTRNSDSCLFKDIIHVGTECRTLNTEIPVSVREQSRQLISEVQPFMQSPDPVHLNFSCALPSLRHSGGSDSPETKEEQKRLGQHDVNMKSSPVEGNLKYCYDRTMQDYGKTENNQRVYHTSSSPPLTQQPITFSPDEVDKYRLLQLQAQQHMQKQHLSKHFKALPTSGSPVFSSAQAIQPVSVQQHPSITTIHHALMQRYAVTAAMHSQTGHLPLPHLNPFPQSHFTPIALSSLSPAVIPAHPAFITGHPLHLVSATAIHPAQLTIQAFPHATLIPTLLTPHPNTGIHPAIHLHPLIHPLFQGQDFHHHSASTQSH